MGNVGYPSKRSILLLTAMAVGLCFSQARAGADLSRADVKGCPSPPVASSSSSSSLLASFSHYTFEPRVVTVDDPSTVTFTVFIEAELESIEIVRYGAESIPLAVVEQYVYRAEIDGQRIIDGYQEGDLHNFVGFLEMRDLTGTVELNLFANVRDDGVPDVPVTVVNESVQYSPYVVNLRRDELWLRGSPFPIDSVQQFYGIFPDVADFVAVVGNVTPRRNRFYSAVRNDTLGIGVSLFDNSAAFGSGGQLQGTIAYPIDSFFDLGVRNTSHEIGHRWINFLSSVPLLATGIAHWPLSDLANGVMGISLPNGVGGQFPYELIEQPDGNYLAHRTDLVLDLNDLELYLMGLVPPEEVEPHVVILDQDQSYQHGTNLGPGETVTIEDVIAAHGPRVPDAGSSQKSFRLATIVLSAGRLLGADEIAFFDYMASRGEANAELWCTSGFVSSFQKPFNVATGGLATLTTRIPCRSGDDTDADQICTAFDNCPAEANADQADADQDGIGDVCDSCSADPANDVDGDEICGDVDNCPAEANADQADADQDGVGDVCDPCPADPADDVDGDDVCADVDNCPLTDNPDQNDFDLDQIGDACETGVALADADNSSSVDGFDLARLARAFGSSCGDSRYDPSVDLNRDCVVDGNDLAVLASHFGDSHSG